MLAKDTQRKGRFLKAEDLVSGSSGHAVLIQFVKEEMVKHRNGMEPAVLVTFAEYPEKVLELNVGNARVLETLFGEDCGPDQLIGQVVWIYSVATEFENQPTMGIRLRAVDDPANGLQGQSAAAATAQHKAVSTPDPTRYAANQGAQRRHTAQGRELTALEQQRLAQHAVNARVGSRPPSGHPDHPLGPQNGVSTAPNLRGESASDLPEEPAGYAQEDADGYGFDQSGGAM